MKIKVILTGATGMVGEGVLLECLEHPDVESVLLMNRKHYEITHPKVKELIVPDFFDLTKMASHLTGYDACFFCAGISSAGMKEPEYTRITYNLTLNVAQTLVSLNPSMVFNYVSGKSTDSSEKGLMMWARVKGRTENALMKLPFKKVYNFRPGLMKPSKGQKSIKNLYKIIAYLYPVFRALTPGQVCPVGTVGLAMINSVLTGYSKTILEVMDIKALAGQDRNR